MAIEQSVNNLITDSIQDRFISLNKELIRLDGKSYPSSGPYKLIHFIRTANNEIISHVNKVIQDKETLSLLTEEQIELLLYRYAKLIPYLHVLLSFIKGAEIKDVPVALINPLKRLINKFLPDAEIIFVSSTIFNYSFIELSEQIKRVFGSYFNESLRNFPEQLIVISFPESEKKNTLLHCIISHEIGHGLYQKSGISEALKKLVFDNIDTQEFEKTIKALFRILQEGKADKNQPSLFPTELQVKEMITSGINETIENWIEELCSDGFGICILGPAFYFSFIHFIISCHYINDISFTHPSPKLRIHLMSNFIQDSNLGFLTIVNSNPKMIDFFTVWNSITKSPSYSKDPVFDLVMKAIYKIQESLKDKIITTMGDKSLTNANLSSLSILVEMITNIIPPNEVIDYNERKTINSDISSILNAGWATYISGFDEFSENIKRNIGDSEKYKIKEKLNELLLKAIELSEIKNIVDEN